MKGILRKIGRNLFFGSVNISVDLWRITILLEANLVSRKHALDAFSDMTTG